MIRTSAAVLFISEYHRGPLLRVAGGYPDSWPSTVVNRSQPIRFTARRSAQDAFWKTQQE